MSRGNVVGVVAAKLDAASPLAASGALPENVNYALKSSFLLSFLESAPEVSAKLKVSAEVETIHTLGAPPRRRRMTDCADFVQRLLVRPLQN